MANEKRLIDANALLAEAEKAKIRFPHDRAIMFDLIKNATTVDAEVIHHGHWVKYNFLGHDQFACSECQTLGSPHWKRCPVCEAKMDGEAINEATSEA